MDTRSDAVSGLDVPPGPAGWAEFAVYGSNLYGAPAGSDSILVVPGSGAAAGVRLRSEVNSELNFSPNFEGLVLGCIDADFCK